MDLTYSPEQTLIQRQAREFFDRELPLPQVRAAWNTASGLPDALWQRVASLGWLGALLPESLGGQALSHTDLGRILEEMGRGLMPGPYLATLWAAQAIALAGTPQQQAQWLPAVAKGQTRLALARSLEGGRFDPTGGRFYADPQAQGYLLFGEKRVVLGLPQADLLVVGAVLGLPQELEQGINWFCVPRHTPGVVVQALEGMEGGLKLASLRLDGVRIPAEQRLGGPAPGSAVLARVTALADLSLALDALGGAARVTEMTVAYAKLRTAFGQPIGAYQAIKHKCADMLYAVENLRAITAWAAWVLDSAPGQADASPALATAMARSTAIEAYDLVIRHGTQAHGAIAVTEEHDLPLFAKRAKTLALCFGSLAHYQELVLRENGFAVPGEGASPAAEPALARSLLAPNPR